MGDGIDLTETAGESEKVGVRYGREVAGVGVYAGVAAEGTGVVAGVA